MLKKIDKQKKLILVIIGVIVILGIVKIIDNNYQTKDNYEIGTSEENDKLVEEKQTEEIIVVYITGEVNSQGVIKLPSGSRIADAVKEAGGLTESANIKNINLAYELEDGEKIYIPNINETETVVTSNSENYTTEQSKNNTININKAGTEELQNLNGIGAGLSKNIVEYREENGKFKQIEDLMNVPGIGENKFNKIKEQIKVK